MRTLLLLLLFPLFTGCDQVGEALGLPDPKKDAAQTEAEGRAIGGACRHAGRSLEDCYSLNPAAQKAWVFAGWKDMNDYMMANKLEVVPSKLPQAIPPGVAEGATASVRAPEPAPVVTPSAPGAAAPTR